LITAPERDVVADGGAFSITSTLGFSRVGAPSSPPPRCGDLDRAHQMEGRRQGAGAGPDVEDVDLQALALDFAHRILLRRHAAGST
jgi:hypothetical protein